MKLLKAKEANLPEFEPRIGDIVFNTKEWLTPLNVEQHATIGTFPFVNLQAFMHEYNPFSVLMKMGIVGAIQLMQDCLYEDPVIGTFELGGERPFYMPNRFYAAIPVAIITTDVNRYKIGAYKDVKEPGSWNAMPFDHDWFRGMHGNRHEEDMFKLDGLRKLMMGSGYTSFTMPSDGSPGWAKVGVALDNGDRLMCWAWEWYNK